MAELEWRRARILRQMPVASAISDSPAAGGCAGLRSVSPVKSAGALGILASSCEFLATTPTGSGGNPASPRMLFRKEAGRMTPRDRRIAGVLAADPKVTNRLIQQGIYSVRHHGRRIGDRRHEFDLNIGLVAR